MPTFVSTIFFAVLAGLPLACAWLVPDTVASAILGWLSAVGLVIAVTRAKRPYLALWLAGIIGHAVAFYWLFFTIRDFGGFGNLPAALVYALFVSISGLQFLVFALFYRALPPPFEYLGIRAATAWVLAELISIRIFPWHLGHTQLAWRTLAQIADLGGAMLISFVMMWTAEALVNAARGKRRAYALIPLLCLGGALFYGRAELRYFTELADFPRTQRVAVMQANISIEEKHNIKLFRRNTDRYIELSRTLLAAENESNLPAPLVIWPESVVVDGIFDRVHSIFEDERIPHIEARGRPSAPLLFGALTYEDERHVYNSGVGIVPDGKVLPPYHKQILMPFGEYTPFSSTFPWLKELNATAGEFIAGTDVTVFEYPLEDAQGRPAPLKLSPLICYEDVLPELSRRAVQAGAELLVNLTNDAWFGDTVAPLQHHIIAAFRSIENRRFLVRSTNSGLTAIVAPTGETVSQIAPFSEGSILAVVNLISYKSLYSSTLGDRPWWALLVIAALAIGVSRLLRRLAPKFS